LIIVDTSVWIEFFRRRGAASSLASLLDAGDVLLHPFVLGELALGNLGRRRSRVLADLRCLPTAVRTEDGDVLQMIESSALSGTGIGWVDAHLLASALASGDSLWTLDTNLSAAARAARVVWVP
jgi:hypothetical protein